VVVGFEQNTRSALCHAPGPHRLDRSLSTQPFDGE
jgi:hypothetical protein